MEKLTVREKMRQGRPYFDDEETEAQRQAVREMLIVTAQTSDNAVRQQAYQNLIF